MLIYSMHIRIVLIFLWIYVVHKIKIPMNIAHKKVTKATYMLHCAFILMLPIFSALCLGFSSGAYPKQGALRSGWGGGSSTLTNDFSN